MFRWSSPWPLINPRFSPKEVIGLLWRLSLRSKVLDPASLIPNSDQDICVRREAGFRQILLGCISIVEKLFRRSLASLDIRVGCVWGACGPRLEFAPVLLLIPLDCRVRSKLCDCLGSQYPILWGSCVVNEGPEGSLRPILVGNGGYDLRG